MEQQLKDQLAIRDKENEILRKALSAIQEICTNYLVKGAYQHQLYEIQQICVIAKKAT